MNATFTFAPAADARGDLRRERTLGLIVIGGFLGGALLWSATARLDAALTAPGVIRLSGQRHLIQTVDGGSVAELPVREGQHVRAGALLVRFAGTTATAQERALAVRVLGLQAQIARLQALQSGAATFAPPPGFAALTGNDRAEAEQAMASARRLRRRPPAGPLRTGDAVEPAAPDRRPGRRHCQAPDLERAAGDAEPRRAGPGPRPCGQGLCPQEPRAGAGTLGGGARR